MTPHVNLRMSERCPLVCVEAMLIAVNQHFKTGYHESVEVVMAARVGATMLRFVHGGNLAYPIIDDITGIVITVYTHEYARKLKRRKKFIRKVCRSRKHWKGKT